MTMTLNAAPPRLSMAIILAAPLVYGIFLLASWLVKVDEVALVAKESRPLTQVTPMDRDPLTPATVKAAPLTLAVQPPPLPHTQVVTVGSAPTFSFAKPDAEFEIIGLKAPVVAVSALAGRNIQVVRAPAPSVPAAAMTRGISGSCDVLFDVDTRGRPFNLTAQCTDDVFKAEAIRAVGKAEFLPKIGKTGVAVEQHGAIYPIEFEVN